MSADLHIHVYEGLEEDDLPQFCRNTMGSKRFGGGFGFAGLRSGPLPEAIYDRIGATPQIWIGEVSWLKAALVEDGDETFIPSTVQVVHDAIGEDLPVLDGDLYEKIVTAFSEENRTGYRLAELEDVKTFLREHMGKRLFTVSW